MLRRIPVLFVWTAFFIGPAVASAQIEALVAAPAPTSQPAAAAAAAATDDEQAQAKSLYDQLLRTQFGEILRGERKLTWDDIRKPDFWFYNFKDLIVAVIAFVPRVIGTIVFLLVFWLIYRGMRRVAMANMKHGEVDSSIRELLGAMIKWVIMGFGFVIACNQLGIPIVAMLTGVSIIGLAVGFAAQETLANFIAGIVIFLDKPFKVGDWIEVDGTFGQVSRVTFRSTRLLTGDGEMHILPNTQMLSNKVQNHSTNPINRVSVPIGIAYGESIDDARRVLLGLTVGDDRLAPEPPPEVVVKECADSSVNLLLRFWIEDESIERRIGFEYLERAKKALDANNIQIPFPHLQLFVEQTPAMAALVGHGAVAGNGNGNGRGIN